MEKDIPKGWWSLSGGYTDGLPDFSGKKIANLETIALGLERYIRDLKCEDGRHVWGSWNAHHDWNVPGGLRVCEFCWVEMPESRKGEKNYVSVEMYKQTKEYQQWHKK